MTACIHRKHPKLILSAAFVIIFAAVFLIYPTSDISLRTSPTSIAVCNTTNTVNGTTDCVGPTTRPTIYYFGGGYRYFHYVYTYGTWPKDVNYPLSDETMFAATSPLYFRPAIASLWATIIAGSIVIVVYCLRRIRAPKP